MALAKASFMARKATWHMPSGAHRARKLLRAVDYQWSARNGLNVPRALTSGGQVTVRGAAREVIPRAAADGDRPGALIHRHDRYQRGHDDSRALRQRGAQDGQQLRLPGT